VALRRRRQRVQARQGVEDHLGAEHGQPGGQLAGRLVGTDRRRGGQQHLPGVHAGVHLERRDAGDRLAADDRPLNGRGAAIPRQERGVNVDRAARRRVEHGLRQDLSEGDDDGDVGAERAQPLGPLGVAQARRLEHRQPGRQRGRLDRRRRQPLAAVRGPIRLGDGGNDRMVPVNRLERRERERRRTVEQDLQWTTARRRGGRRRPR
jgi:hypothetical protein